MLSLREHSCYELKHKLIEKGFSPDVVLAILTEMQDYDYVNDIRFCEVFCRLKFEKGYGSNKIQYELKLKGVESGLVCAELEKYPAEAWLEKAEQLLLKRFGCCAAANDFKVKAKQSRYLFNRGFSSEQINILFKLTS